MVVFNLVKKNVKGVGHSQMQSYDASDSFNLNKHINMKGILHPKLVPVDLTIVILIPTMLCQWAPFLGIRFL